MRDRNDYGTLCLGCKHGEAILIGDKIRVEVVGGTVRLRVTAPKTIPILREKLCGTPKPQ